MHLAVARHRLFAGEMRTNAATVSALVDLDDTVIDGGGVRAETGTRTAAPTSHESNGIIITPATGIDSVKS